MVQLLSFLFLEQSFGKKSDKLLRNTGFLRVKTVQPQEQGWGQVETGEMSPAWEIFQLRQGAIMGKTCNPDDVQSPQLFTWYSFKRRHILR